MFRLSRGAVILTVVTLIFIGAPVAVATTVPWRGTLRVKDGSLAQGATITLQSIT